jgi:hypothetical protein
MMRIVGGLLLKFEIYAKVSTSLYKLCGSLERAGH